MTTTPKTLLDLVEIAYDLSERWLKDNLEHPDFPELAESINDLHDRVVNDEELLQVLEQY